MFWRKKSEAAVDSGWEIPKSLLELLEILDAEYLILAPGEQVLSSSAGTGALAMIREGRLISTPLLNLVRAVRRSNIYQEATVELPRGPIGQGTHDLLVRVSPMGDQGLIVALIFDDSEFRRLDAIRRDFVANISHELKTPIGALSILSEAVLEDGDPLKNAQPHSMTDLINQAIDESRLTAEKRKITLAFLPTKDFKVLGDRGQLEMAISNLIENAINYSPDSTQVAVVLTCTDNLVEISVTDQGIGIPEKEIERIFERFYRVDPARSRATGGTGLGLSIVKHVATNHGGDISVWSSEGSGSTFTIRLPEYIESESHLVTNLEEKS